MMARRPLIKRLVLTGLVALIAVVIWTVIAGVTLALRSQIGWTETAVVLLALIVWLSWEASR